MRTARGFPSMTAEDFAALVQSVREDFQREEDQVLLQRDLHKAEMALAGKYACDLVLRALEAQEGICVVVVRKKGRAR